MTADGDIMKDIERDERWLTELLNATPAPSGAAIANTHQAVWAELEQDLVRRFRDPVPDAATVRRVRQAVRDELNRPNAPLISRRTRWVIGVFSAAACFLAVAGLVHLLAPTEPKAANEIADGQTAKPESTIAIADAAGRIGGESTEQLLQDMATAFQAVSEDRDAALSLLEEDIARLSTTSLDVEVNSVDAELQSLGDEIRGLPLERSLEIET